MDVTLHQGLLEFNWNLLFSAITVFVLYLILKRFFFEKVHYFMLERQANIQEQLTHAEETHKKAESLLEEYSETLANAEEEKRIIIRDAKIIADERATTIISEAKAEASELVEQARKKIAMEEEKAAEELRKEVASLAVMAAGQILEKELDEQSQEALVDKMLEEAADGKWKKV